MVKNLFDNPMKITKFLSITPLTEGPLNMTNFHFI